MDDTIIKIDGLTKDYGQGRGIFNVNLEVRRGECFGCVSNNEPGKTTTIRSMMGFIRTDVDTGFIPGMIVLAAIATVCYAAGAVKFCRKDLPL